MKLGSMKSGVVGLIHGNIDDLSSFHNQFEREGTEFRHSFQVHNTDYTTSGKKVLTGQAATQEIEDSKSVTIDDGNGEIIVQEESTVQGKYTEFVAVPDEFIAVKSGAGTFLFDILSYQYNQDVTRANMDLNEYAEEYYTAEGVDPWQVGFYGNVGNAEKGVVYGENVFSDDEIGEVLERSQLNQLGLQYNEGEYVIKNTLSESGYVELYQPSNFVSTDFAEFVIQNLIQYME